MKSLPWNDLLSLDEQALRTHYPTGATSTSRGRWIPASGDPEKTLDELLREKEARMQAPRFLHRDASKGSTDVLEMALGSKTPRTTNKAGRRQEPEPEQIPSAVENVYAAEANERDGQRAEEVPLWQLVRQLEEGGLPERQKASIRRRVEAARRALAA